MKTVVASRQEESEFEREMEKFLGVGSVKVNRNDENKQQTTAIPSGPNVGKSPPPAFAAQSIAFKMMRKGKDGKREKVDIALPETALFAMEAKIKAHGQCFHTADCLLDCAQLERERVVAFGSVGCS